MFNWFRRDDDIAEIRQIQLAIARDFVKLVETQQATARDVSQLTEIVKTQGENIGGLIAVVGRLTDEVNKVNKDVASLRAGQEQQARVLDYLLRKEQERQNGETK